MKAKMTMEEIRGALDGIAQQLESAARTIRVLAEETKRRPAVRRAPTRSRRVTPEIAAQVLAFIDGEGREMTNEQIGARFGIGAGRVSEIMAGRRDGSPIT